MKEAGVWMKRLWLGWSHVLFPPSCAICGTWVPEGVDVCEDCVAEMERVRLSELDDNVLVRLFMQAAPVVRAASLLRYSPETRVAGLLAEIKYRHRPELARRLGRWMAWELEGRGMFRGIDALVPLPLTPERQKERGYNQSECLARGVSDVVGLPVRTDVARRLFFHTSQTMLSGEERRANVEGAFAPTESYGELCARGEGLRHPLLIDDVVTTGASLMALARAVEAPSLSFLTLAMAGAYHARYPSDEEVRRETGDEVTCVDVDGWK